MMHHIHPSLASADPLHLGEILMQLNDLPVGTLHLDIEDSSFIRNITFGMKTVHAVARHSLHRLSFHLMLANPRAWLDEIAPLNPEWIFFHAEALRNPADDLTAIRRTGAKAGLAFNPATPVEHYSYLCRHLDALLIMTSEPDGRGQRFIPAMTAKVAAAAALFPQAAIWADGGVEVTTAPLLRRNGAQHLVLGRALFSHSDIGQVIQDFAV